MRIVAHANRDAIAPLPEIDGERLFWEMMQVATKPDPWIYPALRKLKASGKFLLGALSNTVSLPHDHSIKSDTLDELRSIFDVFISSAHVGLRKPDRGIYDIAIQELRKAANAETDGKRACERRVELQARDIVFLDDIGENLKTAREMGMRTIKVRLGRGDDAVRELESLTGEVLLERHFRERL